MLIKIICSNVLIVLLNLQTFKTMKGIIIKPRKPNKMVINPQDCNGCIYLPANKKTCKSCGNWKLT